MDQWFAAYLATNAIGVLLLAASVWRPNLARGFLGLTFVAAFAANLSIALLNPESYVDYSDRAWPGYREFIEGPFAENPALLVIPIAIGQLACGVAALSRGWPAKLGLAGMMVFLLAIVPLGYSSAFPFGLVVSGAIALMLRHRYPVSIPAVLLGRRPAPEALDEEMVQRRMREIEQTGMPRNEG